MLPGEPSHFNSLFSIAKCLKLPESRRYIMLYHDISHNPPLNQLCTHHCLIARHAQGGQRDGTWADDEMIYVEIYVF